MKRFQSVPASQTNKARRSKKADSLLQFLAVCPDIFHSLLHGPFFASHQPCVCCCFSFHSYWHSYLCFRKPLWLYWPTYGGLRFFLFQDTYTSAKCPLPYDLYIHGAWELEFSTTEWPEIACFIHSEGYYGASNSEHAWSGNLEECKYLNLNVQDGKQSWQQCQCKALG